MVKMFFDSLITVCFFYLVIFLNVELFATEMPSLSDTRVNIPWKTFNALRKTRTDTVFLNTHENAPVPILFNKADIFLTIKDSVVHCRLSIDFMVLCNQRWASSVFLPGNQSVSFSRIICSEGDFILSTDSGYVLVSENNDVKKHKNLACEWYIPSTFEDGLRSCSFPVPAVAQSKITLSAPSSYSDISIDGYHLVSGVQTSGKRVLTFMVPQSSESAVLQFASPHSTPIEKTADTFKDTVSRIKKVEKITSEQQSIISINDGTVLCLTALTLNVIHTKPSSFVVILPKGYSLLRIDGSGIRKWIPITPDTIRVQLQFNIEDSYTAVFVMETEFDSGGFIPFIDLKGASHQSGSFMLSVKGSDEIIFQKTGNCNWIPGSEFINNMNPVLSESITNLINEGITTINALNNISDGEIAGSFYKTPLNAEFTLRHHKAIPVAQAISDSVTITTCLTDDWKLLTQVNYVINQKNKKYLTVSLPDKCDIWQINVNGKERAPLIDDESKIRVTLPQNHLGGVDNQKIVVNVVYFQKINPTHKLKMSAPTPDIPVSEMSWVLFFSGKKRITDIKGDFSVSKGVFFKRRNQKNKRESAELYQSIQQSSRSQKNPLLLDASPEHIFGKKILVVDEQPVMELIIEKKTHFKGIITGSGVVVAIIITLVFLRRKRAFLQ